ncbi:MAG: ATP-dependent DNA helicase RecG [Candidatus Omnitrophota bacterium]|nr:ATP-dependent DNA helicase RecG [Candidatus Omnitrophota bacterium]
MQPKTSPLEISARFIKGVGPKKFEVLNRLGIFNISDLIYYFPRRYEDRSNLKPISAVKTGDFETIKGRVLALGKRRTRKSMIIFQLAVGDHSGVIYATWFNQPYMEKRFKKGDEVIISGKVELYKRRELLVVDYEILTEDNQDTIHTARIVPVYPLIQDLNQRAVRIIMKNVLDKYVQYLKDTLPLDIRKKYKLFNLQNAVKNIHFPASFNYYDKSRERLVFEEFFLLQMALAARKYHTKQAAVGIKHSVKKELIGSFEQLLSFKLTEAQKKVIVEVENDMKSPRPMNRLVQGDVGSGKTAVAVYALLLTIQNGYQGAIMVPTEVLAEQHYINFSQLLVSLNINLGLLINGLNQKMRQKTLSELSSGKIDIIIGTHSLIQEKVEYKNLGLVIIDEQHKFGVSQRGLLKEKGLVPDCLIMTATPIPRTLALTLYGDLDISVIDEMPRGKKPIATYWVSSSRRGSVYQFIKEQLMKKKQAYVVYPMIEESEKLQVESAVKSKRYLEENVFKGFSVGLIHGRMKAGEKGRVLLDFRDKKIDLLVATTVIEVGIDISNASIMLVENAERFGLAQLHQLRGRVGRGSSASYCVLISDVKASEASQRLKAMISTADGFQIAESDLEIRGPGEFFGTRQHGLPELKIANLTKDLRLLELSQREAFDRIKDDPALSKPQNSALRDKLNSSFPGLKLEDDNRAAG